MSDLPEGRGSGRLDFEAAIRSGLSAAADLGWNSIVLCDADFADWPLGERSTIAALDAWACRGRTLQILASDYAAVRRLHPRFVQWRVTWAHLIEVRACSSALAGDLPSAIWSPGWTLERIDASHGVMVASRDARRHVALAERLDHWWQKGSPSLPPTTLGL